MRQLLVFLISLFLGNHFLHAQDKQLEDLRNKLNGAGDSVRMATLLRIGSYYGQEDVSDSAAWYYNEALKIALKNNYPYGISAAYNNLGSIEYQYERYEKALEMYLKALETSEKHKLYSSMGSSYGSMGRVFEDQEKFDLAVKYFHKAIESHFMANDSIRLPATYVNLGSFYAGRKQFDSAVKYSNNALAVIDALLPRETAPNRLSALGMYRRGAIQIKGWYYEEKGQYDSALAIFHSLKEEVQDYDGIQQKVTFELDLAHAYTGRKDYAKSMQYINQVFEWLKEDSIPYQYELAYEIEAQNYAGLGQFEKAYETHQKFKTLSDSLLTEKNLRITTDMQTKYETDKKEQEIVSLNIEKKSQQRILWISIAAFAVALGLLIMALRSNRLQKRLFKKEKELQKNEMEKRMFELEQTALRAQMNPHFIFNSLNSVQRYVINNDPEGVNMYLSTFANLIRQTLENSGKQLIPLKDEVRYLETYLRLEQMRGNEKFRFSINVTPDIDTEETYIPNMIIQPFLENSIIHGMAGKKNQEGMIDLNISRNGKLTCVVEDNGIGLKLSKQQKLAVESQHESMGSAITQKRIDMFNTMNNEKIELEMVDKSELGASESGTRILIKFPLTSHN